MGSFIADPSTRNQRIEKCGEICFVVFFTFYYILYAREDGQLFTIDNHIDLLVLHLAFLPKINQALNEFKELYNKHQVRAQSNWTPN